MVHGELLESFVLENALDPGAQGARKMLGPYRGGVPKMGVPLNHAFEWGFPLQTIHLGVPPF